MNALIGYYNGDEYGSDGWWEEGATSDEIQRVATENACAAGFDCAPPLVIVDVANLAELTSDDWENLLSQWRLARRNNWVSSDVNAAIKTEKTRRDEN